ncbi:hypothetical protein CAEBREN_11421 [Caenorhabditis brenneri]|uniref:SH3 domain-containing protein n=1 Tax=Caenorhabditis brenneri TaxID=135651 RepID=G0NWA0_CAEBE|nr:hypothetical protein CAEBREN_11421 [Caenorhabditis brenneri]
MKRHSVPFSFAPLFKDCSESFEKGDSFCRYFLKAELAVYSEKRAIISQEGFQVDSLKLDDIPAALNWQSKSDSQFFTTRLQRLVVTVAAPTAIGRKEYVPFHISIRNDYKNSNTVIRAKLIRTRTYTFKKAKQAEHEILNESVQEIDTPYQEFKHILKVHTGSCTFQCPMMSETYRIYVEVTAAMDTMMKLEFPVLVGEWKGEPMRKSHVFRGAGEQVTNIERPLGVPNIILETASASDTAVVSPPYVERMEPPPAYEEAVQAPPLPPKLSPLNETELFYTAKALYSFKAAHPSEISFEIGQVITSVNESDEDGWLVGTIGGRTGLIPGRYVEPVSDDNAT